MGNLFSKKDEANKRPISTEQKTSENSVPSQPGPVDSESDLSVLCTRLWDLDSNRCEPGTHYDIDLQGYVTSGRSISEIDRAKRNLFSWLKEEHVFSKPTYNAFRALLDNYETETGKQEVVTEEEVRENWDFLHCIMKTAVMRETHSILVAKGKAPSDEGDFKKMLYRLWFDLYKRLRTDEHLDSSGFEHVFVGETRGHEVIGFHNWLQFYLQEKEGHIDYRGYFRRGTTKEPSPHLITLQFTWKSWSGKNIGSTFVGTSPEFEMALYTMVFLLRPHNADNNKVEVKIGPYDVDIVCHPLGKGIGTAYIVAK